MITSKVERGHYSVLDSLRAMGQAGLPVLILFVSVIVLWAVDGKVSYPAPTLNLALNAVFSLLMPLTVITLIGRSFLVLGEPRLLMLGCGVVVWAVSGVASLTLSKNDPNTAFTIYNVSFLIAALFHFSGASTFFFLRNRKIRPTGPWLVSAYIGALCCVGMVALAAVNDWAPAFFIPGQGGTLPRQWTLASAFVLFASSAVMLKTHGSPSIFKNWYSLSLLLIAAGILGFFLQSPTLDSPLTWLSRLALFLSGAYMLIAAIESARESRVWEISIEGKLDEAQATMDAALCSMTDAMFISDTDGRFIDFNDAFVTFHRFRSRNECWDSFTQYAEIFEVFFPDGKPAPVETWPVQRALRGEAGTMELGVRRGDTGERWIAHYSFAPIRDKQGTITGSVTVGRDITESKQGEAALKQSEERLALATTGTGIGIFEWQIASEKMLWTQQMDAIFGYGPQLTTTTTTPTPTTTYDYRHWADRVHSEDLPRVEEEMHRCAEERKLLDVQYRVVWPDGRTRWVQTKGVSSCDDLGQGSRLQGIVMDISDGKRAEDALRESEEVLRQANESLEQRVRERTMDMQNLMVQLEKSRSDLRKLASELVVAEERERKRVAGVLHDDICQTLAIARMRVEMLQGTGLNDESSRYLAEAKEFLVQSIRETRDLMNELGNPLLFDMGVAAACESLADRLMIIHPDIRIRCDISDPFKDLDQDVKAVLFQVIRELLNNVIKHSGARNAHVLVNKDGGRIRAEVRDDGMGFDSQKLGAPTNEGGFGLFSIRERLIGFNGNLWIDSTPEAGTIVAAILPMESEKTLTDGSKV